MNVNFYYEISQLKPLIDSIFSDLCSDNQEYRDHGESNLEGLSDMIRILACLKRGEKEEAYTYYVNTPHGEALFERLEKS